MLVSRPGPPEAAGNLRSAFGLARRLESGALAGWVVGIAGFAAVWGLLAETIHDLLEENERLAELFEALGGAGQLTDVSFGAAFGILAIIVSAYGIATVLGLRVEEEEGRAEPVLATPTTRVAWATTHLAYAFGGPLLLLFVAGVTAGAVYGATVGNVGANVFVAVDSALLQLPAIWLTTALVVTIYGFVPRHGGLGWGVLVVLLLLAQLGPILQLPQWMLNVSPFTHVPAPPGPLTVLPLVAMSLGAVALTAAGLAGLRRRDLL